MRILICDDHPIVTLALAALFDAHGHEVVASVSTPADLWPAATQLQPDVCIVDLYYDHVDGIDPALRAITMSAAVADVVVVSGLVDDDNERAAYAAGASSVVDKSLVGDALVAVVEGRAAYVSTDRSPAPIPNPYFLTGRELQVLQCLADGDATERIAARIDAAEATVRSHVQGVLVKLNVHTRGAAVALAVREGLVTTSA